MEQEKLQVEERQNIEEKTDDSVNNEHQLANGKVTVDPEPQSKENHISAVSESAANAQEDTPKKSYASIVSSQTKKGNAVPVRVYVPTKTSKVAPPKTEKRAVSSVSQDPAGAVPNAPSSPGSNNIQNEGIRAFNL